MYVSGTICIEEVGQLVTMFKNRENERPNQYERNELDK